MRQIVFKILGIAFLLSSCIVHKCSATSFDNGYSISKEEEALVQQEEELMPKWHNRW